MSDPDRIVDARGLLCPWPVLRLSRAARELGGMGRILLLADDPVTGPEVAQLCAERGWVLAENEGDPAAYTVVMG